VAGLVAVAAFEAARRGEVWQAVALAADCRWYAPCVTGPRSSLLCVERVFISSLFRGEMAAIRQAVRAAVDSLDMRPVMFETEPARDEASRRALLDQVARSDVVVLLLGAEYGEPVARGVSPTEEEFNEARERGIPVQALVQRIEREPAQDEFVRRVRGGWEQGRFAPEFTDASDVGFAAVRALNVWRQQSAGGDTAADAQSRALELARGHESSGAYYGGSKLRVVVVPALSRPLLDALSIRDAALVDDLAGAARSTRLAPHSAGIEASDQGGSIAFTLRGGHGFEQLTLRVGFEGSVVAEGPVGGDEQGFGGMLVVADHARKVMECALAFAEAVWRRIDSRDEVRDVFIACAVPEANHKVYALEPAVGSLGMGVGGPHVLIAPEPPLAARRADLPAAVDRLQAELHRAFELLGAVHPRAER
jgi:hypothetical protein